MTQGLNFICRFAITFLAFVSFLYAPISLAQGAGRTKDEFSDFEAELEANTSDSAPAAGSTKKPVIKATPKINPGGQNQVLETKNSTATPAPKAEGTPAANRIAEPAPAKPPVNLISSDEKIERLKKEIRDNPKNGTLISSLGQELYKKGEYEKVTLLLWKHIDKMDRAGLMTLARAHEKRKEPAEMIRALNVEIGKDDKDFEAYTLLGAAHVLNKKNREALDAYKKAVELNPRYEPAYDGLISIYEKREPPNLYELRILYQDLIEKIGSRPQYLHKLCEINTLDETFEAAIQSCQEAITREPSKAESHVYLGLAEKATGEEAKAKATFKRTAITYPKSEFAQYQYAKVLEDQKNYVDAMNTYKKATEVDGNSSRSWLGLATASFEIRKYDIAYVAFQKACRLDHKTAVAFRRATTVLRNQKNSEWVDRFEAASDTCTFKN